MRQFWLTFVKCLSEDLQEWAEEVTQRGLLLQQEPESSFPGPSKVGPMPPLSFERVYMWISLALIQLVHTAGSDSWGPREGRAGDHREG